MSRAQARTPEDDRIIHASAAFGVSMVTTQVLKKAGMGNTAATILGSAFTFGLGVVKEVGDPIYDKRDVESNALGCAGSAILNLTFDF